MHDKVLLFLFLGIPSESFCTFSGYCVTNLDASKIVRAAQLSWVVVSIVRLRHRAKTEKTHWARDWSVRRAIPEHRVVREEA